MIVPATVSVLLEIRNERQRQVESERWSFEHDDQHIGGELALAGACYALVGSQQMSREGGPPPYWPFSIEHWKLKNRRYDLVRATALLVAEIERLDRATEREAAAK